ncbi:MAG: hypothetical protein AAGE80_19905, partial [Pseudomonadota bacterium]
MSINELASIYGTSISRRSRFRSLFSPIQRSTTVRHSGVTRDLRKACVANPSLKLMFCCTDFREPGGKRFAQPMGRTTLIKTRLDASWFEPGRKGLGTSGCSI